jgi:beta-lactamase regulating signal transducer with metallopeptidase domain
MLSSLFWNVLLTTALALVLAGLCRLPWMYKRPALRHWLWLLLLAKLITPPLIAVPMLPPIAHHDQSVAIETSTAASTEQHNSIADRQTLANAAVETAIRKPVADRESAAKRDTQPAATIEQPAAATVGNVPHLQGNAHVPFSAVALAISLMGTCLLLGIHGVHSAKLHRWLKRAGSRDAMLANTCADIASSLGIQVAVRSCVVNARTAPLLWAWPRPLVVVPRQLVDDLSQQQLRGIVAHELAHYWRGDHWANLFAMVVRVLLWWNPVVWWAVRELHAAQELCCDAIAIDRCHTNRRSYAAMLLQTLEFLQTDRLRRSALALGMGTRSSLLGRFEMIGDARLAYQQSRWTMPALAVLALAFLCIPVRAQSEHDVAPAKSATSDIRATEAETDSKDRSKKIPRIFSDAVLSIDVLSQ